MDNKLEKQIKWAIVIIVLTVSLIVLHLRIKYMTSQIEQLQTTVTELSANQIHAAKTQVFILEQLAK